MISNKIDKASILVSVIVPIYGVEKYIERCARSIFNQTYENLEIIFINDCTPDRSMDVLNKVLNDFPKRKLQTKIIHHKHNKGLAGARLTGLNASTGYYIQNIDSDDYLDLQMIEKMVDLAEIEKADITICDITRVYNDRIIVTHVNPSLNPRILLQQVLSGFVHSSVCNKLIRRSLYFDHGILPIEGLNMREDLSVMFRLLYFAKRIAYISEPFYYYYLENEGSYTAEKMNLMQQKNAFDLICIMDDFFHSNTNDDQIQQSFRFFKVCIISSIALNGDLYYYEKESNLFNDVSIKDILSAKQRISKIQKFAGLLLKENLFFFLKILRYIKKIKNK